MRNLLLADVCGDLGLQLLRKQKELLFCYIDEDTHTPFCLPCLKLGMVLTNQLIIWEGADLSQGEVGRLDTGPNLVDTQAKQTYLTVIDTA